MDYHDLPDELPGVLAEIVGLWDDPAEGREVALRLVRHFGGQQLYVPSLDLMLKEARNDRIRAECNGKNFAALARKYGLSTTRIRDIVGPVKQDVPDGPRQGSLMDCFREE